MVGLCLLWSSTQTEILAHAASKATLNFEPVLYTFAFRFTVRNNNPFLETPFSRLQAPSVALTRVPYDDDDELQQDWYSRV